MKNSFFLKLGIGIIAIFGVLIAGFVFWKPLNIQYYKYRVASDDLETRKAAAKYLLDADAVKPVRYYYENRYNSKDVKERLAVVDELCALGDKGKELMREMFRERCKREMVLIPAGSFMMGSENGAADEKPVHEVTLSAFWMDKYEVTNEKYYAFVNCANHRQPIHWKSRGIPSGLEIHPVVWVSWEDANAYSEWLKMMLPTEAEWEYACRAGSSGEYCFGNNEGELREYAWFQSTGSNITHPVGMKISNKWQLFDMHGNAYEWCNDWYGNDYYRISPTNNPAGPPGGVERVLRSGCSYYNTAPCRSSDRLRYEPTGGGSSLEVFGFRVCRSASEP
jgi:formylglycine-generating enzyme required for sulfatase activity